METNFSLSKINEEEVLNDDEKSFIQGLCIESHTRFCSKIIKVLSKGRHQKKKNCRFGEIVTIGGEGVRKIIEFSSFANDEKHGRGGSQSNISLLHRTQL